jgi:hypothetical protein
VRASPILPPSYQEAIGSAFMVMRKYEEAAKSFLAIRSGDWYIHVWAAAAPCGLPLSIWQDGADVVICDGSLFEQSLS